MSFATDCAERGLLPDWLIRRGIRSLLRKRLRNEWQKAPSAEAALTQAVEQFSQGPLAVHTQAANDQHYEVPPRFFELVLGKHLKYSSCLYESASDSLDSAERQMLDTTIERAELADGQRILEIGCGWGSLTLSMARRFPAAQITAVSNSAPQRRFIEERCRQEGLDNVSIITVNLPDFVCTETYDRIVSVECFEHMRNYRELFQRLSNWLSADGKCFIHVFCHQHLAYPFEDERGDDWMARHFFTGGTMPALGLFPRINDHLACEATWAVSGTHYGHTSRHWLENLDAHRDEVIALFSADLGQRQARRHFRRWRLFFMACEECFHYDGGNQWLVGHYRFSQSASQAQSAAA